MENSQEWMVYFTVIVTCLLAVSEGLTLIPAVKSNGVFQLLVNILKFLAGNKE